MAQRQCLNCKNIYSTGRKRKGKKYCSRDCWRAHWHGENTHMFGRALSSNAKKKISELHKGNKYNLGKSRSEEEREKISERMTGEKHWNWKGGVSRAYKTGYYSVQYKRWRISVFERDNYTCQDCGSHGSNTYLNAHHIKSFSQFPDLRFEVSNGKTLCEYCHSMTDNYKGRGNVLQKLEI